MGIGEGQEEAAGGGREGGQAAATRAKGRSVARAPMGSERIIIAGCPAIDRMSTAERRPLSIRQNVPFGRSGNRRS